MKCQWLRAGITATVGSVSVRLPTSVFPESVELPRKSPISVLNSGDESRSMSVITGSETWRAVFGN